LFVVEGARFIELALDAGARPERLYRADPAAHPEDADRLEASLGAPATRVSREVLAWASSVESEVDLLGLFPFRSRGIGSSERPLRRVLVLEAIADPGNLGSAVRSAAAAGMDAVIVAGECADWTNPKAVRASAGAVFALEMLRARSVREALEVLDLPGLGAEARATRTIFDFTPPEKYAVVIGHETRGLSAESREACTELLRIPMAPPVESLNAAVAGAVFLYALARGDLGGRAAQ
jgi:tRNA G18 (ribose-2'-O)-methylase SpoU